MKSLLSRLILLAVAWLIAAPFISVPLHDIGVAVYGAGIGLFLFGPTIGWLGAEFGHRHGVRALVCAIRAPLEAGNTEVVLKLLKSLRDDGMVD